jgi:hypothetical protein
VLPVQHGAPNAENSQGALLQLSAAHLSHFAYIYHYLVIFGGKTGHLRRQKMHLNLEE